MNSPSDDAIGTGGTAVSPLGVPPARAWGLVFAILPALLLAAGATAACRAAAGVSLGLLFGGVAVATFLVPPLVAGESATRRRIIVAAFVCLGVCVVWLTAVGDLVRFSQWLACSAVLLAYAAALAGLCSLLVETRWNRPIAAALVTTLGLLWLTWPVWLSAALVRPAGESLTSWLVPAHPLFAINGVLAHFDSWDRYPLAYRQLTVLNQDVFYAMPTTVTWAVTTHAAVAATSFGLAYLVGRRRGKRDDAHAARGSWEPIVRPRATE